MARLDPLRRSAALERYAQLAAERSMPHSVLVEGPEGSGKEAVALALAGILLGGDEASRHKVERIAHPDLLYVFPAESSLSADGHREILDTKAEEPLARIRQPSSAIIPIGDSDKPGPCSVRWVRRFASATPFEAPHRVVIFSDAHRMNRASANALLKTLEEPPASAVLLLCTHQSHLLPATVRSRCARLRVPGLSEAELAGHLQTVHGVEAAPAAQLAAVSGGNARRAFDLIDPEAQLVAGWAGTLLEFLLRGERTELLKGAERVAKGQDPRGGKGPKLSDASLSASRDVAVRTLDFLVAQLTALARAREGAQLSPAVEGGLRAWAEAPLPMDPQAAAGVLLRARGDLLRNVNVGLVLSDAFLAAARAEARGAEA